jgi:hypothetical protein
MLLFYGEFSEFPDVELNFTFEASNVTVLDFNRVVDVHLVNLLVPQRQLYASGLVRYHDACYLVGFILESGHDFAGFTFLDNFGLDVNPLHPVSQFSDIQSFLSPYLNLNLLSHIAKFSLRDGSEKLSVAEKSFNPYKSCPFNPPTYPTPRKPKIVTVIAKLATETNMHFNHPNCWMLTVPSPSAWVEPTGTAGATAVSARMMKVPKAKSHTQTAT